MTEDKTKYEIWIESSKTKDYLTAKYIEDKLNEGEMLDKYQVVFIKRTN